MATKKQSQPKTKSLPTAVIVIPTYNEADSISDMITHLFIKTFPTIKDYRMLLLIVDDTSPDGTYKIVQKLQKKYKNLHLLLNPDKVGIGGAYVKGFKYAMDKLKADVLIEFDGDFQHPPSAIPALLKKISSGADYVLGSRYIPGGSTPKGWGFNRVFLSRFGGLVARFMLFFPFKPFFAITDPTTGLKASRVKGFVDHMDMDHLYTRSFGYKIEFLYKMVQLKAKVAEIPLQFGLRNAGESKITGGTAKEIFLTTFLLRWNDPFTQKFLKFGTVGFIGYVVNASLLALIARAGYPEWVAWLGSTEAAIISNFTFNNLWTFKEDKITGLSSLINKFVQFNLTSAGALLIQTIAGTVGVYFLGPQYRQLLLPFIIVFLVLPYNWTMYNLVIWRKKK